MASDPTVTSAAPAAAAAPALNPAPVTPQAAAQQTIAAAVSAGEALLGHAAKPGPTTTEFWAPIVYPLVAFVVAFLLAFVAAHGFASNAGVATIVPVAAGSIASAAAHVAASVYVRSRTALKAELLRAGVAKS